MKKLLPISTLLALALALPGVAHAETEAEAMTTAIKHAATDGLSGPLTIQSSGPVSRAQAHAVLYQEPVSSTTPSSTAFPFVLNSSSPFAPNVPVPPHVTMGKVRYLAVTISPGWVEETFSSNPISLASLGTVVTVDLSSTQASTASKSCQVDRLLVNALGSKRLHTRLASAQHSLKKCKAKHR
jgi:hypothetical protein